MSLHYDPMGLSWYSHGKPVGPPDRRSIGDPQAPHGPANTINLRESYALSVGEPWTPSGSPMSQHYHPIEDYCGGRPTGDSWASRGPVAKTKMTEAEARWGGTG